MLRRWSLGRVQAELGALEASAERAGLALARIYTSSHARAAAEIRARRIVRQRTLRMIAIMRLVVGATALGSIAILAALAAFAAGII